MGDKSDIQWTDATWNPAVGCSKVSTGCLHCYAEMVHQTRLDGRGAYPSFKPWTHLNAAHNVTFIPERLDQPLRWRKPRMIFVNSMSDLFHENLLPEQIAACFAIMAQANWHVFQVLTKRPERMRELLNDPAFLKLIRGANVFTGETRPIQFPLPHVWLGTSIENVKWTHRADDLRATPAAVRWISAEPLLGPLTVGRSGEGLPDFKGALDLHKIDWLVVGGESGPKYRPMNPAWARDLRDLATKGAGEARPTRFFFKQVGGRTPGAGGRLLDGREWNEYPEGMNAWLSSER